MKVDKTYDTFRMLKDNLGEKIYHEIEALGLPAEKINEIRLTVNKPICVFSERTILPLEYITNQKEIEEIFAILCEYSVHAYKNEIIKGFITVRGGIRIGICGTAVYGHNETDNIRYISSLVIRIPHEFIGISEKIAVYENDGGILISGPPCSGKTTMLRDIARRISEESKVIIVDERNEISGMFHGVPGFDIGFCGVMNCFNKPDGIEMAVRSLSPDFIVCDEFGNEDDINSALFAMKSGVKIIASIHAADREDLFEKPFFDKIIKKRIFEHVVFLNKKYEIDEIVRSSEFIG